MSKREIRFELALGMTENDQKRMKNHILDILRGWVIESIDINTYNIEIIFKGPHAGAYDMQIVAEDLQDWQNDNITIARDELIAE